MPESTLQDRVRSFKTNLELLATVTGDMELKENAAARSFYEYWSALNKECIAAGFDNGEGNFSYVAMQLNRLLPNFPADKTKVDIRDIFPEGSGFGRFLFGCYIDELERVVVATPIPA